MPVTPRPPRFLRAERVDRDALDVPAERLRDDDGRVRDEVLDREFVFRRDDERLARVTESLLDVERLVFDDREDAAVAREDVFQFRDQLDERGILVLDALAFESDERAQAHVEDGVGLDDAEFEARHELLARDVRRGALADDADDLLDVVEGDAEAFEDVRAVARLLQIVGRAPAHDVEAVVDPVREQHAQAEHLRLERRRGARRMHGSGGALRYEREHVEAEARLQW